MRLLTFTVRKTITVSNKPVILDYRVLLITDRPITYQELMDEYPLIKNYETMDESWADGNIDNFPHDFLITSLPESQKEMVSLLNLKSELVAIQDQVASEKEELLIKIEELRKLQDTEVVGNIGIINELTRVDNPKDEELI